MALREDFSPAGKFVRIQRKRTLGAPPPKGKLFIPATGD
jgi:hypothetical protein